MRLPVRFRQRASRALVSAFDWYSSESRDLGRAFLTEIDAAIGRVADLPGRYPVIYRDTRRALVARFPYAIIFRVFPDHVMVLAILHTRRDPARWQVREPAAVAA